MLPRRMSLPVTIALTLGLTATAARATDYAASTEGDFVAKGYYLPIPASADTPSLANFWAADMGNSWRGLATRSLGTK